MTDPFTSDIFPPEPPTSESTDSDWTSPPAPPGSDISIKVEPEPSEEGEIDCCITVVVTSENDVTVDVFDCATRRQITRTGDGDGDKGTAILTNPSGPNEYRVYLRLCGPRAGDKVRIVVCELLPGGMQGRCVFMEYRVRENCDCEDVEVKMTPKAKARPAKAASRQTKKPKPVLKKKSVKPKPKAKAKPKPTKPKTKVKAKPAKKKKARR